MPKVAQHSVSGMFYQGWGTTRAMSSWSEKECVICPLPMFHVLAVYPMLMTCIASGSHIVFPTPQGYRGDGVFDNFWKLVERWEATFMVMVPTAATALMQRPINADVSSLKYAICGSSPLPADKQGIFKTTHVSARLSGTPFEIECRSCSYCGSCFSGHFMELDSTHQRAGGWKEITDKIHAGSFSWKNLKG